MNDPTASKCPIYLKVSALFYSSFFHFKVNFFVWFTFVLFQQRGNSIWRTVRMRQSLWRLRRRMKKHIVSCCFFFFGGGRGWGGETVLSVVLDVAVASRTTLSAVSQWKRKRNSTECCTWCFSGMQEAERETVQSVVFDVSVAHKRLKEKQCWVLRLMFQWHIRGRKRNSAECCVWCFSGT